MVLNQKGIAVKNRLLQTGKEEMIKNSFAQVGVAKICSKTGLPKGSFFYYFSSKEEFGVELFRGYMLEYFEEVQSILFPSKTKGKNTNGKNTNGKNTSGKNGFERIWQLHQHFYEKHKKNNWEIPCLFMKVSAEVSGISDDIRKVIAEGIGKVMGLHVEVVEEGIKDGSIFTQGFTAEELGEMIFMQWKGAALISSVHLNDEALKNFFSYLKLFKETKNKTK